MTAVHWGVDDVHLSTAFQVGVQGFSVPPGHLPDAMAIQGLLRSVFVPEAEDLFDSCDALFEGHALFLRLPVFERVKERHDRLDRQIAFLADAILLGRG